MKKEGQSKRQTKCLRPCWTLPRDINGNPDLENSNNQTPIKHLSSIKAQPINHHYVPFQLAQRWRLNIVDWPLPSSSPFISLFILRLSLLNQTMARQLAGKSRWAAFFLFYLSQSLSCHLHPQASTTTITKACWLTPSLPLLYHFDSTPCS